MEKRLSELLKEIAEQFGFEIEIMDMVSDHIDLFLSAPPKYLPSKIVSIFKGITAHIMFQEFPELKKHLWGGKFWSDGYFVRTKGDKVTSEIIRKYIRYQKHVKEEQLEFFKEKMPRPSGRGALLYSFPPPQQCPAGRRAGTGNSNTRSKGPRKYNRCKCSLIR